MSKAGPKTSCHSPLKEDKQAKPCLQRNRHCFWPAKEENKQGSIPNI